MKEGWEVKKLGEVSVFYNGYTPKETELFDSGIIPYFKVSDMNHPMNKKFLVHTDLFLNESNKIYPRNTIVFPKNGAAIATNKKRILERESVVDLNTGGIGVKDNCIYYLFLYYYLNNIDLKKYTRRGAVPTLDLKELKSLSIYLPPLPEQSRIVEELDLLSNIIEKKRQQLSELDNLAQSIFYDMFGDPIMNEKGWEVKKLGDVYAINPSKKTTLIGIEGDDMVSFLPMEDLPIKACYVTPKQNRTCNEVMSSYTCFANNDVLMAKVTPCFENGKVGIASNLINGVGFGSSEFIVIRSKELAVKEYVYHLVQTDNFVEKACKQFTGTSGLRRVPKQFVEQLKIGIAPLSLQQLFAQKIEAIEKQKELIKQSIAETEELFNSRMDYYFS